jgi:hypothetical protein
VTVNGQLALRWDAQQETNSELENSGALRRQERREAPEKFVATDDDLPSLFFEALGEMEAV